MRAVRLVSSRLATAVFGAARFDLRTRQNFGSRMERSIIRHLQFHISKQRLLLRALKEAPLERVFRLFAVGIVLRDGPRPRIDIDRSAVRTTGSRVHIIVAPSAFVSASGVLALDESLL